MKKLLTCIECPKGCVLSIDIEICNRFTGQIPRSENCRISKVSGNECPKGEEYAHQEIENPMRILTSAVLTQGFALKMVPVRTDKPIPKSRIMEAMDEIKKIRLKKPVKTGEVVLENLLGIGANVISVRDVGLA